MTLGDEAFKIFLNASGTKNDVSEKLLDFFQLMKTGEGKTELAKKIHDEVERARTHEEWRTEYMTLFMRDQEMKEQGKTEMLLELVREGTISVKVASEKMQVTEADIEKMLTVKKN